VLISALVAGLSTRVMDSAVLSPDQKDQLNTVVEQSVSAVSDAQVQNALQGQSQAVVDEVTRINREARDRALGLALLTVGLIAFIGLGAAMLLPEEAGRPQIEPVPGDEPGASRAG
jgi:hypothetical protein